MSEWQDDDEVTTTYGSIQLSLSQAHAAGIKTERERIIDLFEVGIKDCANGNPKSCDHCLSIKFYIAMITGNLDLQKEIINFVESMEGEINE